MIAHGHPVANGQKNNAKAGLFRNPAVGRQPGTLIPGWVRRHRRGQDDREIRGIGARIRGEIALVGSVSGVGGLPPIDMLYRSLNVAGTAIGPRTTFEALLTAMAMHEVRPVIDRGFPFAEYREAYWRLESGNHVGKVVIDMVH